MQMVEKSALVTPYSVVILIGKISQKIIGNDMGIHYIRIMSKLNSVSV